MSLHSFWRSRSGRDLGVVIATTVLTSLLLFGTDAAHQFIRWFHAALHPEPVGYLPEALTILVVCTTALIVYAYRRWTDLVREIQRRKRVESELRVLRGLIPICGFCRRIRDPDGDWLSLEKYLSVYSEAELSHGLCCECAETRFFARS